MSEPKASLLEAAFTVIATLTEFKPASQVIGSKGVANSTIIPDLPLIDGDSHPLIDFVLLFADLQFKIDADYKEAKSPFFSEIDPKDRKYRRPPIFRGNYPNAPRDGSLGAITLVAAIGSWAKEHEPFRGDNRASYATRVLDLLAQKPHYVVSYEEFRQESFGHHLVNISISEDLPELIRAAQKAKLHGVEKMDDPKFKLYKFFFDRFLQKFSKATFRDFLATRAEYPSKLSPLFEQYMTSEYNQLSPELIKSARAYGKSLNRAAYKTAKKEETEDTNSGRKARPLQEYKNRILIQFESTILSAKSPTALLSQMNIITGRLTGLEIDNEAELFMITVAAWPDENLSLAKELVTAFMRLNSYVVNEKEADGSSKVDIKSNDVLNDPQPN
jgi:hypothetical protein